MELIMKYLIIMGERSVREVIVERPDRPNVGYII